jgi:hypothetical protein
MTKTLTDEEMEALFGPSEEQGSSATGETQESPPIGRLSEEEASAIFASQDADDIDSRMFDGILYEEAEEQFQELTEDPRVSTTFFGKGPAIYEDPNTGEREFILPPQPRAFKAITEGAVDLFTDGPEAALETITNPEAKPSFRLGAGLVESGFDTAEAVASGLDYFKNVREGTAGTADAETNAADAVRDRAVRVDAEGLTDSLITDAAPAALAALTGAAGTAKALPAARGAIGKTLRALGIGITSEAAAAAGVGTDEGTLIVGEDSASYPFFQGLDLGEGDAERVLEQRFNTMLEGLALGSAAVGVTASLKELGSLGAKFTVEPLFTAVSKGRTERRAISRIMDELTVITDASTPEEIYQVRENIAEIVENNKEVVLNSLSDVDEPLRFNLDTVSALARGADGPITDQLLSIRSGLLQRSGVSSQTQSAVARPAAELEQQTEEYLRRVGGETADDQVDTMAAAGREVTDELSARVDEAQGGVRAAQDAYDESVEAVRRSMQDDLEVGQQIQQLEDLTGTEIVTGPGTSRRQIRDRLSSGYESMKQTKNRLFAQVTGGPVDVRSLYDAFAEADLDELTKKSRDIRATSPLRELAALLQPRRVPVGGETGTRAVSEFDPAAAGPPAAGDGTRLETPDEVVERVQEFFAQDPDKYNFGFFNNEIRNELNRAAQDFYKRGEGSSADVLRGIIDTIDGPMTDYVAREGDPALRQAALNARDYYKNEFSPVWRSEGVMQDYAKAYENTIARGGGFERGSAEKSNRIVGSVLTGGDSEEVRSMQLAIEASGQDASPIADYFVSDAVSGLWGRVRRDGIDSVDSADLEQSLRQYAAALQETFPEKAEGVNRFIGRLRQAQGDKQRLEAVIRDAGTKAEEATRRLQKTEMARFLRENSEALGIAPTSNPETAFREILSKGRPLDRLRRFKDEISTLPEGRRAVVQDGLETAYTRLLRQRAIGRTLELGGSRRPRTGAIEDAGEQIDPQDLVRVGREVFSDKPEVMEAVEPLMEVTGMVQRSKEARPISVFTSTAFSQDAQRATNRLIYITTGPLSRAGTRIRAFLGAFVENMAPDQRAAYVMDNILADPDKFVSLARKYNKNPQSGRAREELMRAMFSGAIKADTDEGDVPSANNLREQMLQLIPETPDMLKPPR